MPLASRILLRALLVHVRRPDTRTTKVFFSLLPAFPHWLSANPLWVLNRLFVLAKLKFCLFQC